MFEKWQWKNLKTKMRTHEWFSKYKEEIAHQEILLCQAKEVNRKAEEEKLKSKRVKESLENRPYKRIRKDRC